MFYEKLEELSKISGKSVNQIERELGYPRNALHNYKNGKVPSGIRLLEVAQYFKVSPEYLLGKENRQDTMKNFFLQLSPEQKVAMTELCFQWVFSTVQRNV